MSKIQEEEERKTIVRNFKVIFPDDDECDVPYIT
jgi:hypothetical protein